MKTKTVKKLNIALLLALLCLLTGVSVFLVVAQKHKGNLSAKAGNVFALNESEELGQILNKEEANCDDVILAESSDGVAVEKKEIEEKENAAEKSNSEEVLSRENGDSKFSFVAIGDADSRKEQTGFSAKLDFALSKAKDYLPDFVLFTGDVLRIGLDGEDQSKGRIQGLKTLVQKHFNNYYFAFGNHDIECGDECIGLWEQTFFGKDEKESKSEHVLYHSFNFQNTHFVLLSTDYPKRYTVDEKQIKWLEEDLSKNELPNVIVVQHVPPIVFFKDSDRQCHDMTCDEATRNKLISIFKKYKVDLVISGNENAFDHQIVEGIDFVLSGSIGSESQPKGAIKGDLYVLCSVDGEEISVEAMNTQGQVIRKIKIK